MLIISRALFKSLTKCVVVILTRALSKRNCNVEGLCSRKTELVGVI